MELGIPRDFEGSAREIGKQSDRNVPVVEEKDADESRKVEYGI